jgi:hypothetical protein
VTTGKDSIPGAGVQRGKNILRKGISEDGNSCNALVLYRVSVANQRVPSLVDKPCRLAGVGRLVLPELALIKGEEGRGRRDVR